MLEMADTDKDLIEKTTDTHTQMETSKQKEGVNKRRIKNIERMVGNK
jgi:hypothetical protein